MGCFTKFALFVTNFIVFAAGIAVVTLGSIIISKDSTYGVLLQEGTMSLPIVIVVSGIIILVIGFLGCCGAMQESSCMLYLYAGIVFILLIGEIVMGIMILVYSNKSESFIVNAMTNMFNKYGGRDRSLTKAIDNAQHDLKCCGIHNYTDWEDFHYSQQHNDSLADGCCKDDYFTTGCGIGLLNDPDLLNKTYTQGCYYVIKDDVRGAAIGLGVACLILAAVQCFSICCACGIAKEH